MSTKTELLARIDDLSAQLGRELPRSGTIAELESIVAGAESELDILNEQSGDESDADTNASASDDDVTVPNNRQSRARRHNQNCPPPRAASDCVTRWTFITT